MELPPLQTPHDLANSVRARLRFVRENCASVEIRESFRVRPRAPRSGSPQLTRLAQERRAAMSQPRRLDLPRHLARLVADLLRRRSRREADQTIEDGPPRPLPSLASSSCLPLATRLPLRADLGRDGARHGGSHRVLHPDEVFQNSASPDHAGAAPPRPFSIAGQVDAAE